MPPIHHQGRQRSKRLGGSFRVENGVREGRDFAKHLLSNDLCHDWAKCEQPCLLQRHLALEHN